MQISEITLSLECSRQYVESRIKGCNIHTADIQGITVYSFTQGQMLSLMQSNYGTVMRAKILPRTLNILPLSECKTYLLLYSSFCDCQLAPSSDECFHLTAYLLRSIDTESGESIGILVLEAVIDKLLQHGKTPFPS